MIPGQLGPTRRDFDWFLSALATYNRQFIQLHTPRMVDSHTLISSDWGIPSVIQTISGISLLMASMMASAAAGGGT